MNYDIRQFEHASPDPLAATMAEKVETLRKWAHGRARLATSSPTGGGTGTNGRRLAAMPGRN